MRSFRKELPRNCLKAPDCWQKSTGCRIVQQKAKGSMEPDPIGRNLLHDLITDVSRESPVDQHYTLESSHVK